MRKQREAADGEEGSRRQNVEGGRSLQKGKKAEGGRTKKVVKGRSQKAETGRRK